MKRAITAIPQSKIIAFGGDTVNIEYTIGYLALARDNVAIALSEMLDSKWLNMSDARQIAVDWFFKQSPTKYLNLAMNLLLFKYLVL